MQPVGRTMGLDVGTRTIGVALSDRLGLAAHPLATLERRGVRQDAEQLAAICREQEVVRLVVGLPLHLDGREGRSCRLARQVGEATARAAGIPVVYVDERFTTVEAERILKRAGRGRRARRERIDQVAASLILQAWLDHGQAVEEPPPGG